MTTCRAIIHKYRIPAIQCLIIFIIGISGIILFEYYTVTGEHGMQTADVENGAFSRFSQRNIMGEIQDSQTRAQSNAVPRNEHGSSQRSSDAVGTQRGRLNELRSPGNMDNLKATLRAKGATDSQIDLIAQKMTEGDTDFVKNVLEARGISEDKLYQLLQQPGNARIDDGNNAARAPGAPDFTYLKQFLRKKHAPENVIDDIIQHFAQGDIDYVENMLKRTHIDQDHIDEIIKMGSTGKSDYRNNIAETEKQSGFQSAMHRINGDSIQQATGNNEYRDMQIFLKQNQAPDVLIDDITRHMVQGDTDYVKLILKTNRVPEDKIAKVIKLGNTGNNGQNIIETKTESGDQTPFIQQQATGNNDYKNMQIFLKQNRAPNALIDDITRHMAQGDTDYVKRILKRNRVPEDKIATVIKLGNTGNNGQNIIDTRKEAGDQTGLMQQQATGNTDSKYKGLKNYLKQQGASDGLVDDITEHLAQGDTEFVRNILKAKRVPENMIDKVIKLG